MGILLEGDRQIPFWSYEFCRILSVLIAPKGQDLSILDERKPALCLFRRILAVARVEEQHL